MESSQSRWHLRKSLDMNPGGFTDLIKAFDMGGFIDLIKAFDSVTREGRYELEKFGIRPKENSGTKFQDPLTSLR
jgi:hypothetical protein